ncbi:hypothetical protein [Chitinimonas sp.]|uniref:hypothetical protein n=1 Tax=Chitinimonas sp. TaxID=1934313 RepID=UPI0035AEB581
MLNQLPLITYRSQIATWLAAASLLSALVAAAGGYYSGYRHASRDGAAQLASLKADHAIAYADSVKRAANRYAEQAEREALLAIQLRTALAELDRTRQSRLERIDRVTTHYQPAPGAALLPAPRCIITRGWVRDYNAAFGLSDDSRAAASAQSGDAASQAGAADGGLLADDLQDSGVSLADVRAHTEDLAAWCRATAAQRDALIHARTEHD